MDHDLLLARIVELEKEFLKLKMTQPKSFKLKQTYDTYFLNVRLYNSAVPKIRRYFYVDFKGDQFRPTLEE